MPAYLISTTTKERSRATGVVAVAVVVVAALVWLVISAAMPDNDLEVSLRTPRIGDGVVAGTTVALNGVKIGSVKSVESSTNGTQIITLRLHGARAAGLTDDFAVDYAPENLFGITAVNLRSGTAGTALQNKQLVDLTGSGSVTDSTMGTLLTSMGDISAQILTPKLADLLRQSRTSLNAFSPLLQAMLTITREAADARKYPTHVLLDKYAEVLDGGGKLTVSTLTLFKSVYDIPILRDQRQLFDITIGLLADDALPLFAQLSTSSRDPYEPYTTMLTPMMQAVARTVPTPSTSRAQLSDLLRRIDGLFTESASGPTINVALTFLVPVLAGGPVPPSAMGQNPTREGAHR